LEFSLTPTPAEPRTLGVEVLKSLANVDATYSALLPEGGTPPVQDADGAETEAAESVSVPDKEIIMSDEATPTVDVNAIAQAAANEAVKAYVATLKPDNPQPLATTGAPMYIKSLNDSPIKAMAYYLRTGKAVSDLQWIDNGELKAYNNTDMNIATPADGGYAVPTGMLQEIIARRDEIYVGARLGVRNIPGKGLTVNVPIDAEADVVFTAVNEAASINQDAPALNQAAMTLVKYAKYITLSWELLRDEDADLIAFLNDWLARGWAGTLNSLLVTEAAAGGTAAVTVSATPTAAQIASLAGALAPEYQDGAAWLMNPAIYATLSGITGNPFTFVSTPQGNISGPSLMGYPVERSSYAATAAASAKVIYFGNWNFMGVRNPTELTLIRDPYSASLTGQVRIVAWFDAVFKTLQAEAIVYGTQST
jgi:HK97 family phage major capsid protein